MLQGEVEVADGLRLDPLGSIHDQQGAFARGDGSAHLVAEVHVAGGIDQVEDVLLPVQGVVHLDRLALDGDAAFALQVHVIQVLGLHVAVGDGAGHLQQAVGQGALAVVDVGDDAEIADVLHGGPCGKKREGSAVYRCALCGPCGSDLGWVQVDQHHAYAWSRTRKGGWAIAQSPVLSTTITLDRLAKRGYEALLDHYRKVAPHLNEPLYTRPAWPAQSVAEGYSGVRGAPRR